MTNDEIVLLIKRANEAYDGGDFTHAITILKEAAALLLSQASRQTGEKKAASVKQANELVGVIEIIKRKRAAEENKPKQPKTEPPKTINPHQAPKRDATVKPPVPKIKPVPTFPPNTVVAPDSPNAFQEVLAPRLLSDYYGQDQAVVAVKDAIGASRLQNRALPHIILYGSHGLGKTTFARIIANEMRSRFIEINPTGLTVNNLIAVLKTIQPKDILFIDEIHTIPQSVAESVLYSAMQDFKITQMQSDEYGTRPVEYQIPRFTLIGATTDLGLLPAPMVQRAFIQCRLVPYTNDVIAYIVSVQFSKLSMKIQPNTANAIAARCRNNPRTASALVTKIADKAICYFAEQKNIKAQGSLNSLAAIKALNIEINDGLVEEFFTENGIDRLGLESGDREYLNLLVKTYKGGPVSIETLARAMNENQNVLRRRYEDYLIRLSFVKITPQGREATDEAFEYLGITPKRKKSDDKPPKPKYDKPKPYISQDHVEPDDSSVPWFTDKPKDVKRTGGSFKSNDTNNVPSYTNTPNGSKTVYVSRDKNNMMCRVLDSLIRFPKTEKTYEEDITGLFNLPIFAGEQDPYEIKLVGTTTRTLHCGNELTEKFIKFCAKSGYIQDAVVNITDFDNDSIPKKHYSHFAVKMQDGRIVVFQVNKGRSISCCDNLKVYADLEKYCEEKGYGYAQLIYSTDSQRFTSVEKIKRSPVEIKLKDYIHQIIEDRARNCIPAVFEQSDLKEYASHEAVGEYAVHTIVLRDDSLKNTSQFGDRIFIEQNRAQ